MFIFCLLFVLSKFLTAFIDAKNCSLLGSFKNELNNQKVCGILYQKSNCEGLYKIIFDGENEDINDLSKNFKFINETLLFKTEIQTSYETSNANVSWSNGIQSREVHPHCVMDFYDQIGTGISIYNPKKMNIKKGRYSCYCFQSCDLKFQWQKKHECFGNSQNVCNYLLKSGINENDIPLEGKPVKVVINEIAYNVSTIFNDIEYLNITEKWKQILEANKWDSNDNEKMLNFNITKNRNLIFEQYIAICDTVKWKSEEYRIIEKNLKTEEEEIVFPKNLYDVKFEEIDQWGDDKEIRMIITNNDKQSICPEQIVFELDEKSSIKKSWNLESEMNNDIFDFPPKLEISPGKEHRGSGFILNGNIPNFTITFKNCNLISRTGPEGFHLKALEILSDGERKKFIVTAYNRIQKPLYCGSFALFFSNNTKIESMWNMKKRTTKNENDYDFPDWLIFKPGEFYAETGFILSEGDLQDAKGIIHRYSDGYNHELQYCPLYGFQIEIISTSIIENNLTKIDFKVVNYDIKPICKGRFELEISKDSKILSLWNMKRSSRQEVYEYTFPQPWRLEPSQTVQNMGIIIEGNLSRVFGTFHAYCKNSSIKSKNAINLSLEKTCTSENKTEILINVKNSGFKDVCYLKFKMSLPKNAKIFSKWNFLNGKVLNVYKMHEWWKVKAGTTNQDAGFIFEGNIEVQPDWIKLLECDSCDI